MMGSPTRSSLSSKARSAILAQHDQLRHLVAAVSEAARVTARTSQSFDLLRARAQALYLALDEHMRFEESILEAALRDVIGRGAELHAQLERDHQRQRAVLTTAIAELGRGDLSAEALVHSVRRFVDVLVRDMDAEEELLLSADVDALLVDGEAG
jgi:iron-sulfur cluster repair protein YtfE (RIC family)